jgi:VIT1/CCC1 family predicted Fe2+/Mn2+ transporter
MKDHGHHKHAESEIHGEKSIFSRFQDYLGEFVYGGIDGSVTTFAVVAGSAGAGLESSIIIILGFANLIADGFAMSVGSYLSTKSEKQKYEKHKAVEYWEVDNLPEKEREEIREIYEAKGFEGELLEKVVDTITADKDRWVDVMMKEELEMAEETKSPLAMGGVTFISFLIFGFVPLIIYVLDYLNPLDNLFLISSILTGVCFVLIGLLKSVVTDTSKFRGIIETVILGGAAATLSYFVGDLLEHMIK